MKVVVVQNKKEWLKNLWMPKEVNGLPIIEDENMPKMTYKIREVDDD